MSTSDRTKRVLKKKADIQACYSRVFETADGKVVLEDLCRRYKVFIPKPYPGADHAFNDGAIQAILSILHYSKLNHSRLLTMMQKQVNDYEDIT